MLVLLTELILFIVESVGLFGLVIIDAPDADIVVDGDDKDDNAGVDDGPVEVPHGFAFTTASGGLTLVPTDTVCFDVCTGFRMKLSRENDDALEVISALELTPLTFLFVELDEVVAVIAEVVETLIEVDVRIGAGKGGDNTDRPFFIIVDNVGLPAEASNGSRLVFTAEVGAEIAPHTLPEGVVD